MIPKYAEYKPALKNSSKRCGQCFWIRKGNFCERWKTHVQLSYTCNSFKIK